MRHSSTLDRVYAPLCRSVPFTENVTHVFLCLCLCCCRCGPCRLSVPVVKEVIKEYTGQIESVEVCTDDFPEVASNAGVVSIPTIQIYYQGEVQDTIVGCVAKKVLSMAVEKVLEDLADGDAPNGDGGSK